MDLNFSNLSYSALGESPQNDFYSLSIEKIMNRFKITETDLVPFQDLPSAGISFKELVHTGDSTLCLDLRTSFSIPFIKSASPVFLGRS